MFVMLGLHDLAPFVSLKFLFGFVNQRFSFSLALVCSFLPIATMPKQNPHRVSLVSILMITVS